MKEFLEDKLLLSVMEDAKDIVKPSCQGNMSSIMTIKTVKSQNTAFSSLNKEVLSSSWWSKNGNENIFVTSLGIIMSKVTCTC